MKKKLKTEKFRLSEFRFDNEDNVYFHQNSNKFSYSDGIETENYIFNAIKKSDDVSNHSLELIRWIKDWPSYYHLGTGRSNIFDVLNLSHDSKVLELGSGCGAVTRYLGENFRTVDAVEGSQIRAQITSERCRDLDNVNVYCSNFNNIQFDNSYDIVTAIGVLEYAPVYYDDLKTSEDSCLSFLNHIKSALNNSGVLIIGIENKIGIKYWGGCIEDHTERKFDGIHDYPNAKGPITFSKREIEDLLNKAGFSNVSFFYCFPDYKFANTIISDVSENNCYLHNWIEIPFKSNSLSRNFIFHEGLAIKTLYESGLLKEFANSFLILASMDKFKVEDPEWIIKKISVDRKDKFKCITTLKSMPQLYVEKERLSSNKDIIFANEGVNIKHKVGTRNWVKGDSMIFDVYKAFFKSNWKEEILNVLEIYYQELSSNFSGKLDQEGYPLLELTDIDFTIANFIKSGDELVFVDNEFEVVKIPADYVIYRCIRYNIIEWNEFFLRKKVIDTNKFAIQLIRNFFHQYNNERHKKNKTYEDSFQKIIKVEYSQITSNGNLESKFKKFAKMLPETIKEYIKTLNVRMKT